MQLLLQILLLSPVFMQAKTLADLKNKICVYKTNQIYKLDLTFKDLTDISGIDQLHIIYNGTEVPLTEVPHLELDLRNNQLIELPAEIGNLSNLESLILVTNHLISLPPELGNLSNLKILKLNDNQLTSIPTEIGNLSNLKTLWLAHNQLAELPAEICNLSNLENLSLARNHLTSLPIEIGNLSNLKILWLAYNQLTELPSEIGNLCNLKELLLAHNQLIALPSDMVRMPFPLIVDEPLNAKAIKLHADREAMYASPLKKWMPQMTSIMHTTINGINYHYFNLSKLKLTDLCDINILRIKDFTQGNSKVKDIIDIENLYINLENNKIMQLPKEISELQLRGIKLDGNTQLNDILALLKLQDSLYELSLSKCTAVSREQIQAVVKKNIATLEMLDLTDIDFIDSLLQELASVLRQSTQIQHINHTLLENQPEIIQLLGCNRIRNKQLRTY